MTEEEKAVFECMEDEKNVFDGQYEELDDDFLAELNEGAPAMESTLVKPPVLGHEDLEPLEEEKEDPESMMLPDYKEKMADVIAMLDK